MVLFCFIYVYSLYQTLVSNIQWFVFFFFFVSSLSFSLAIVPYLFYLSFSLGSHSWPSQYQPHQSLRVIENIKWLCYAQKQTMLNNKNKMTIIFVAKVFDYYITLS
jgi:hypothetical protein